jgi:hypothetical protein
VADLTWRGAFLAAFLEAVSGFGGHTAGSTVK